MKHLWSPAIYHEIQNNINRSQIAKIKRDKGNEDDNTICIGSIKHILSRDLHPTLMKKKKHEIFFH